MMAAPQILSRAALPSLIHSLDASDVLECYHLTRHAPLHLNLTTSTPIIIPKSAIGLRYNSGTKGQMELTLEYGPQRLGNNQEEEALPSLEESFVSWQNDARIYYSTTVAPQEWESAHYMASITGVVLERLLQKAVDYPRKRYQPFVAQLVTSTTTTTGTDNTNNNNNKIVLKSSSDLDFLNFMWESLATLGVSLRPLLPPRQYEARLYVTDISKLPSGQVVLSETATTPTTRRNSTVAQEAFGFFQKLQTCVSAIATAQDPPTKEPTTMPSMMTTSTDEPTNYNDNDNATTVEPTNDDGKDVRVDDNDDDDDDAGANDDIQKGADQEVNVQHNATDDDVDNINDNHNSYQDGNVTIENHNGETGGENDGDDNAVDQDGNEDQVDNADNDDTQDGTLRFRRFLSSWQQYVFPQSQEPRGVEDGSVVDHVDHSYNKNQTVDYGNATIPPPPNEAQVASEAAQEAKEAAKEAKEAATTEADTRAADAAEAAANAAQKAANVTLVKQKKVMQQNLLSGDGDAISAALRECFTNPQYRLTSSSGTALVYLYLDGATYYQLNLTAPYVDVALVERPIPQAHEFATPAGGGGGDFIDWTLALGTIGFFVVFVVLMLQRGGFRLFQPLYKMQKWYFSPSEVPDSDEENVPIGQGYEHAFGEDVIPLSMGGRRPLSVFRKRRRVVPVFLELNGNDDHSGDFEMVDSPKTPRRSPESSGHDLGFGPSSMDMHSLPDRLARDPELVDLPNLNSGSKVAVPVSIQHQRIRSRSQELGDIADDDSDASKSR
jgi:hypothetical protein